MFEKKHTLIFFFFILTSTALVLFSFMGRWNGGVFNKVDSDGPRSKAMQETYMKGVDYFVLKEKKPYFTLVADEMTNNNSQQKTYFLKPKGYVVGKSGEHINYESLKGFYDKASEKLVLEEQTHLQSESTEAWARKMTYESTKDRVHMEEKVKTKTFHEKEGDWIHIDSEEAFFWPEAELSRYLGKVDGKVLRKMVYEESLYFKSNELYLDLRKSKAELTHDVWMKKQNLTATSRRGEIFLENYNKKLKYFVLYDDVKVIEKVMLDGKFIMRKAFSEKLEGLAGESKVILTGYPKVYQVNDLIKGNRIVLRQNTEVVEVDDANTKFKVE